MAPFRVEKCARDVHDLGVIPIAASNNAAVVGDSDQNSATGGVEKRTELSCEIASRDGRLFELSKRILARRDQSCKLVGRERPSHHPYFSRRRANASSPPSRINSAASRTSDLSIAPRATTRPPRSLASSTMICSASPRTGIFAL